MADAGDDNDDALSGKKNPLILAAELIARSTASHQGWLQKLSSSGRWSKRYFLLLPGAGAQRFLVYYRSANPEAPILASMDVSQAGDPAVSPGDSSGCEFSIFWDKQRRFRAGSPEEAARWVACIAAAQGRKRGGGARGAAAAGFQSGEGGFSPGAEKGRDWGERPPAGGGQCCCAVV
jgi:hypothetical protein